MFLMMCGACITRKVSKNFYVKNSLGKLFYSCNKNLFSFYFFDKIIQISFLSVQKKLKNEKKK